MNFSKTSPQMLAREVFENIDKHVQNANIPLEGAKNAATIIETII
jgi:hypothetical protein